MQQLSFSVLESAATKCRRAITQERAAALCTAATVLYFSPIDTQVAQAQTTFSHLFSFGDSYADGGINSSNIPFTSTSYPSAGMSPTAVAAGNSFVIAYPYWLQSLLGLKNSQVTSYAITGATTGDVNATGSPFSLSYELARFAGQSIAPTDLVTLSIGGNDALLASGALRAAFFLGPSGTAFNSAQATELAAAATVNTSNAVHQLVSAGARTLVIAGLSDLSVLPASSTVPLRDSLSLYGQNYFAGVQSALAPLARSGARIFLFDETRMMQQVQANLGGYGFGSYAYSPSAQSLFLWDGVHLSSQGFLLEAKYMANLLQAPATVAAQGELGQVAINNLSGALYQRLDAFRSLDQNRLAYAAVDPSLYRKSLGGGQSASAGGEQPLSVYIAGDYAAGKRSDRDGSTGFSYELAGGTVGVDYKLDQHLRVGAAFNYVNPTATLNLGSGHISLNAYQFGGFASVNYSAWFTDFVVTYGRDVYDLDRPGIVDTVRGKTNGDSFTAGLKGGYLFDVASARIGPVTGMVYSRSSVNAYTEAGDPLLAFTVLQPNLESLTGSAGMQVRAPFNIGPMFFSPYVNVTAEHEFKDGNRTLLSVETQAPILPIYSSMPGPGQITYGKIAGGIAAQISQQIGVAINAAGTFARDGGNDFAVSGRFKLEFAAR